ncbi:uncharacterized protein LOC142230914 [Haematobia irritans]|uniref:uncharacterized protein LOC142230914 n=1 Tax=Haematobia irritans TaxID=7368 RepID=UPI003F4F5266
MSLKDFIRSADRLAEFEAALSNKELPLSSIYDLEVHREEAKSRWHKLTSEYEKCLSSIEKKGADSGDASVSGKESQGDVGNIKEKYKRAYIAYTKCISSLKELGQEIRPKAQTAETGPSYSFNLPPCELAVFQGDYMSWPTFRDMFTAVCINNSKLSPIERLFHLVNKTRGEAHDIVSRSPLTNDGFFSAWENLCARYENKRVLVNGQLRTLFNLPSCTSESANGIKTLQRDISACISALSLYDIDIASWDPIFVYICSNRLPSLTLTLWEQTITDKASIPKWKELDTFLTSRYQTLESVTDIKGSNDQKGHTSKDVKSSQKKQSSNNIRIFRTNVDQPKCHICDNESHVIKNCPRFLNMDYNERISTIKSGKMCLNCFSGAHSLKNCKSKCSCFKCRRRHHTLLHREQTTSRISAPSLASPHSEQVSTGGAVTSNISPQISSISLQPSTSGAVNNVHTYFSTGCSGILLGTAIVSVCLPGATYEVRALIDSGSEGTLISERIFNQLKLPFRRTSARVSGLNSTITASVCKECCFTLGSSFSDVRVPVSALVVPHLSANLPSRSLETHCLPDLPDIRLADPKYYESSKVDILIGSDILPSIMLGGFKSQIGGSLMAQETIFGWILTGPISQTVRHGEFPKQLYLGQSRKNSMAQFFRNEGRLLKDIGLKEEYDRVLLEYISLDHMRPLKYSTSSFEGPHYYMPHHAVLKPESTSTKVRVVFNASSITSNGNSLNDVLHVGPVLQRDLTVLILKWRFFRYVFNGDIQKMYRQILIHPEQRRFQRILFRTNQLQPLRDYELQTVTFGVNCAPYLAIRTMIQLAADVQTEYPLASKILSDCMYVDDAQAGAHTIPLAIKSLRELINALGSAGFTMKKWTSNSKEILAGIPPNHLLYEDFLDFDSTSSAKTLGIRWNARSDSFFFVPSNIMTSNAYTKREVLSQISKIFDPAGWLSPIVVRAKIIMQRIWLDGTKWDEGISHESLQMWKLFKEEYPIHKNSKAYAAVLYVRVQKRESIFTHLIASKTKVAPVKTISVPRLELCGAVLLADIIDNLLPQLGVPKYKLFCWTDSKIVLSWLAKPPCLWTTFVANRVAKIIQVTDVSMWHHVVSEENPADLSSRGVSPRELAENPLWWQGPHWLQKEKDDWPISVVSTFSEELEKKEVKVHFSYFQDFEDILERFSSFSKAMRVISYVYRFFNKTHPKHRSNLQYSTLVISAAEIIHARNRLVVIYQKVHYTNEYMALSAGKPISSSSSLLNLNPFIDNDGLIRVCGRLEQSSCLSYSEKFPIIVPYNCPYARLVIRFVHEISLHGGNQLVLRLTRSTYWIPRMQNLIKATIRKCKVCIIHKKKSKSQLMASLPPERCTISLPFTHTGLDFAGPFDIKNYTGRACLITKGYVCVFVCFSTKAIHLEATSDLSTQTFLAAFSRFVSRRGCPLHLHSDNGTTPLSPMSTDPADCSALTPGHFLVGSPLLVPIDPLITDPPASLRNRWLKMKLIHQHFCTRWKNEYLTELHKRNKWKRPEEDISIGALVVVKEDNLPPNSWRLGRKYASTL